MRWLHGSFGINAKRFRALKPLCVALITGLFLRFRADLVCLHKQLRESGTEPFPGSPSLSSVVPGMSS
jgi:hypothetical protein